MRENRPGHRKNQDYYLWEQLKRGDKSALHKIYTGHYSGMLDYGLRLIPDRAFVTESIQQVFRDLISRMDTLNSTSRIRYYLLSALKRHILELDGNKPEKKFKQVNAHGFNFSPKNIHFTGKIYLGPNGDPGKGSYRGFSSREKEAMYLRFHQGLNDFEVSRMIGFSGGSARDLLVRAIRKYRTQRDAANSS